MASTLKFTNLIPNYAQNCKPYKFINKLSPSAAAVKSETRLRRQYSAGWCSGRIIQCASAAYARISSDFFNRRENRRIFGGEKSRLFTSDSRNRREDGNFRAQMGATVNGKVGNQYCESDVSPPQNHREKTASSQPVKLLTLPTILTIGRVVAVPILAGTFYVESWWGPPATTVIFIVAAFTDWLDGYLARKMNLRTQFGAFLDPVADKLMVAATLILLCTKPFDAGVFGQVPWLLTVPAIAIIGREITMSAVREWAASQDRKLLEAVAVNNLGKWKTATQMSALTILLATRDGSLIGAETLACSGVVLLYISSWLTLWSLLVYMRKIRKVLLR